MWIWFSFTCSRIGNQLTGNLTLLHRSLMIKIQYIFSCQTLDFSPSRFQLANHKELVWKQKSLKYDFQLQIKHCPKETHTCKEVTSSLRMKWKQSRFPDQAWEQPRFQTRVWMQNYMKVVWLKSDVTQKKIYTSVLPARKHSSTLLSSTWTRFLHHALWTSGKALQGSWTHRTIHQTYLTCHGVFRCTQLLSQLLHVVWMNLLVQSAAKPLRLGLVQHRSHRVWHVDHSSRLSCNYKQEPICSLQDKVFQLLPKKGFGQNVSKERELNIMSVTVREYCFLVILAADQSLDRDFHWCNNTTKLVARHEFPISITNNILFPIIAFHLVISMHFRKINN